MKRLIVEHLGPIEKINIELNSDYYAFIGAQASGKSTLTKCLYFGKYSLEKFLEYAFDVALLKYDYQQKEWISDISKKFAELYKNIFVPKLCLNSCITYYYTDNCWFKAAVNFKGRLKIEFSNHLKKLFIDNIEDVVKLFRTLDNDDYAEIVTHAISFRRNMKKHIYDLLDEKNDLVYIPACRSNVMFNLKKSQMDAVMEQFVIDIDNYKAAYDRDTLADVAELRVKKDVGFNEILNKFIDLSKNILKGSYCKKEDDEFIKISDDISIPLLHCSSGQQEALWIVNMLFYALIKNTKTTFIIEEPEAHLYPDAQYDIVNLIALVVNYIGGKVIITTHSPYVLATMNLLIYSGAVEKKQCEDSVVNSAYRIDPQAISAYELGNGIASNLYDAEEQLIHIERIDVVASKINALFDNVFEKSTIIDVS